MSKIQNLLLLMKDDIWYKEKELIKEYKLLGIRITHTSISPLLYYGVCNDYIIRRKRTIRNWEYCRDLSLNDVREM